jgi:carboxylate-amine ligase
VIERAFGESPWTVGVEEELLLVDAETLAPVGSAPEVLELGLDGVKQELFAAMIETTTGICAGAHEAGERLRERRRALADAGVAFLAAGSHPFGIPEEESFAPEPLYQELGAELGPAMARQLVCGLHVHVGMPDAETCVRAHEGALPWLPLVLAVSANSPWFRGEVTGLYSKRAEVLASLPRAGTPPPFASYEDWERMMQRWLDAGVFARLTSSWWDARVHPGLGTLELRVPDQPTSVERATAFVALLHALAVHAARCELRLASRADYTNSRFFASRFGPGAQLLHPEDDRLVTVPELYADLRERLEPVVDELGVAELIEPIDPERCEADDQLAARDPQAAAQALALASRA